MRPAISKLPSGIGGVNYPPEVIEQLCIADLGRIKEDLHGFVMAGCAGAHLFVCRILLRATGVARNHAHHAGDFLQVSLDAPKASASQRGRLIIAQTANVILG